MIDMLESWRERRTVTLNRRDFMRAGAITIGTTAVPAMAMAALRSAVGDANLSDATIMSLSNELDGTLILQNSYIPSFEDAAKLFNSRFNSIRPLAIARCKNAADVQRSMRWCIANNIHFVARAGGHSYCGWSSCEGLVIDVGDLQDKSYDACSGKVSFGSGMLLVDAYHYLGTNFQRAIPGGTCPSVGLSGLTLGGGQGMLSRQYGMTSDSLIGATVALYDGTDVYEVTCTEDNAHHDLLWALRGGGGGNFGIVTSLTFKTWPQATASWASVEWNWSDARKVLDFWMDWGPTVDPSISMSLKFRTPLVLDEHDDLIVGLEACCTGSETDMLNILAPLLQPEIGTPTKLVHDGGWDWFDVAVLFGDCSDFSSPYDNCHFQSPKWPEGVLQQWTYKSKSDFYKDAIPSAGFDAMEHWLRARHKNLDMPLLGQIQFDLYGSASVINQMPRDATAFVHRDSICCAQYLAFWDPADPCHIVDENMAWIRGFYQAMRPWASDESYQNYCDNDLHDWAQRYYGSNLPELRRIKSLYDPDNVFYFPQSIPPAKGGLL
jgi:hypothetical protein